MSYWCCRKLKIKTENKSIQRLFETTQLSNRMTSDLQMSWAVLSIFWRVRQILLRSDISVIPIIPLFRSYCILYDFQCSPFFRNIYIVRPYFKGKISCKRIRSGGRVTFIRKIYERREDSIRIDTYILKI